ncbi:MAG: cobyrinate a,c-diamide synthase [Treponema sp.]|nr:cobyrinate a,c-diamide synthase [Treponema sp.]
MEAKKHIRRFMIASPCSGSGKTLFSCALMNLLKRKFELSAFKCGPDFIDPLFHKKVLDLPSVNLDGYFDVGKDLLQLFVEESSENRISIVEGAMGFFDGVGGTSLQASCYDVAVTTKTPVILVVDARGASRSLCATIKGFVKYAKKNIVKGIFLNKVSKSFYPLLKNMIEKECKVKVLGFLPFDDRLSWNSRHLGLVLPNEIQDFKNQIDLASALLEESLDQTALLNIAADVSGLKVVMNNSFEKFIKEKKYNGLKIGIAYDDAFCFYYKKNIRMIEEAGASVEYFSPLNDSKVPDVDGIIIGGGYPELYADKLEENYSMKNSICALVKDNIPVLADCGGFMYLQKELACQDGIKHKMCGAIEGESFYTGKLVRFGYAQYTSKDLCFKIRGHEFHYFESSNNGDEFISEKPSGRKVSPCIVKQKNVLAGFPHLYYNSCPEFLASFLDKAVAYKASKGVSDER